jgi:hypothetical protein
MRRATILFSLMAALALCAVAVTGQAQDAKMTINNAKAYASGKQRGKVAFTHEKHVTDGFKCTDCHHKYDPKQPGKNLWTEGDETSCASCHAGAKPKSKVDLQTAFHKSCWGCHEKMPHDKKLAFGPRSCAGCHEAK